HAGLLGADYLLVARDHRMVRSYVKLNFRDRSCQVAKTYQLSSKATTSNIAPSHPTRLGKKTAVPSFWRSCVCTSMSREREPPTAKKATATHSFTCPSRAPRT